MKLLNKIKSKLVIRHETKHKLFILVNKYVFCSMLKFHLPVPQQNGYKCVICQKSVDFI